MAQVNKPYVFQDGQVAEAPQVNSDFDALYNVINGNLDNTNISPSAAINDSQLAQIVTGGKVSGLALTAMSSTPGANAANGVLILNSSGQIPAVDGHLITGLSVPFSTQNVVTGSRALTTPYQNTTGKIMYVSVSVMFTGGSAPADIFFKTDSNSTPTTEVDHNVIGYINAHYYVRGLVLPNNYYEITYAQGSMTNVSAPTWTEWY